MINQGWVNQAAPPALTLNRSNSTMNATAPIIPFRPLGLIMNVIETCGLNVGHLYEDLIFTEENMILMRMEADPKLVSFYVNEDCESRVAKKLAEKLSLNALDEGLKFVRKGSYALCQSGRQSVQVLFADN